MPLASLCDRLPLDRLRRWRLRLRCELARLENIGGDSLWLRRQYDALAVEIAEQNCKRQCDAIERYKTGDAGAKCKPGEMSRWWWDRY